MKAIARTCWDVFLLRSGPSAFPRSWTLLAIVVPVYIVTDALTFLAQGLGAQSIALQTTFDFGLQVLFFTLVLGAKFHLARLRQTLAAWFGASVIMNVLVLPVNLGWLLSKAGWAQEFWFVAACLCIAWGMAIMAGVLRQALDIGMAFGLVIAAVYTFVNLVVFAGLFPG